MLALPESVEDISTERADYPEGVDGNLLFNLSVFTRRIALGEATAEDAALVDSLFEELPDDLVASLEEANVSDPDSIRSVMTEPGMILLLDRTLAVYKRWLGVLAQVSSEDYVEPTSLLGLDALERFYERNRMSIDYLVSLIAVVAFTGVGVVGGIAVAKLLGVTKTVTILFAIFGAGAVWAQSSPGPVGTAGFIATVVLDTDSPEQNLECIRQAPRPNNTVLYTLVVRELPFPIEAIAYASVYSSPYMAVVGPPRPRGTSRTLYAPNITPIPSSAGIGEGWVLGECGEVTASEDGVIEFEYIVQRSRLYVTGLIRP